MKTHKGKFFWALGQRGPMKELIVYNVQLFLWHFKEEGAMETFLSQAPGNLSTDTKFSSSVLSNILKVTYESFSISNS